jgi:integrase
MFNKARDWGEFSGENPVSRVKFFREGGKVRPLSEADIATVLDAAQAISADKFTSPMGRALYDVCRLVLNTGLRRSEALNLRWVDIIDDELRIRGKGGKVRMVPLNAEARRIITGRARLTPYLFDVPNRNSSDVMRRVSETVARRTKAPFHIHLLRHAFASRLLAAGVDVVTISHILGHSAVMTALLYTHSNPKLMREAVTKLGHGRKD